MGFWETVTPGEMETARSVSLATMVVLLSSGAIPPLRPYAYRIRVVVTAAYLLSIATFGVYFLWFR